MFELNFTAVILIALQKLPGHSVRVEKNELVNIHQF